MSEDGDGDPREGDASTTRAGVQRRRWLTGRGGPAGAAMAMVLLAAACASGTPEESPTLKENELTARLLMSDFESGDVSDLSGLFFPSAVYDDYSSQREYRGLEEISGYVTSLQDWANGIVMSVNRVHAYDTGAVVEWTLSAVQDKPIPGRVTTATGHEIVVNGVTVLTIDNHRITRAADYMDDLTMMLQLGGELHMPGGLIVKNDVPSLPDGAPTGNTTGGGG